jgi:large subunit ribosomal protein L22
MEAVATLRYGRMAPRKIRLVVDLVRGKRVEEAMSILSFTPKVAARVVKKLIKSAMANAENKGDIDVDTLYIKRIFVDEGPTLKRFTPRAMGRATSIRKRTSHITVVLDEL